MSLSGYCFEATTFEVTPTAALCSVHQITPARLKEFSILPDQRQHRGPHPQDHELFSAPMTPRLCEATRDLSWLLTRGYAANSARKIVGDRYALVARQRLAVARCACGDDEASRRQQHQVETTNLWHQELWIDTYNVLTSLEAALSGAVILHARDGCYRDMASMHGSYHKVEETLPALHLLGQLISSWEVATCHWLLDKPVSNSGRLKTLLREVSEASGWQWHAELVSDPDAVLISSDQIVASADSRILNQARHWFNLAKVAIDTCVDDAWIMDCSCR